eukprot:CAMPEP_0181419994 /NCGR_PEP_ID=MMETSP1110-20121109/12357_1 /TAXON_ID=174948 /ORGANISM="Symbiodinium sp., Strain CCMP421" /LENGTH=564 /DNA_ID=CAMNT_0023543021 /DNA_START=276 /DNA_END=1967 /DNA_ORIENTATION=-
MSTSNHLRVARCEAPRRVACRVLVDELAPLPASQSNGHYGLNRFAQNTTGVLNCMRRMQDADGDTFLFSEGRCQVQKCGNMQVFEQATDKEELNAGTYSLWSRFCDSSRPHLVAAQLFEWTWTDVASECEEYLAPAGFSAVQVSPPSEHILGSSWTTRYHPVSFKLNSRSGIYFEFVDMVRRCKAAGVDVMVDVILDHMAPARDESGVCGGRSACVGWAGTRYGDRDFTNGRPGIDYFDKGMFHHYPGDNASNCIHMPGTLSNPRLCDVNGPHLDIEQEQVQDQLYKYLAELMEIGVTMLRVGDLQNLYPDSLAQLLLRLPWEYLLLEGAEMPQGVGPLRSFSFADPALGQQASEALHTSEPESEPILRQSSRIERLSFLDNPSLQREWILSGQIRLTHKHGLTYHLTQLFMLASAPGPVRLMSSYAFTHYHQGPPEGHPSPKLCWDTPDIPETPETSPAQEPTEPKEPSKEPSPPWVCEHRWQGIAGLLRLRQHVKSSARTVRSGDGLLAISFENQADTRLSGFVAIAVGSDTISLAGRPTGMPPGCYCNLAAEAAVPEPDKW